MNKIKLSIVGAGMIFVAGSMAITMVFAGPPIIDALELINQLTEARNSLRSQPYLTREMKTTLTRIDDDLKALLEYQGLEDGLSFDGSSAELAQRLQKSKQLLSQYTQQADQLKKAGGQHDLTIKESQTLERLHERLSHLKGEVQGLEQRLQLNKDVPPGKMNAAIDDLLSNTRLKGGQYSPQSLINTVNKTLEKVGDILFDIERSARNLFSQGPLSRKMSFEEWRLRQQRLGGRPSTDKAGFVLIPQRRLPAAPATTEFPPLKLYRLDGDPDILPFEKSPTPILRLEMRKCLKIYEPPEAEPAIPPPPKSNSAAGPGQSLPAGRPSNLGRFLTQGLRTLLPGLFTIGVQIGVGVIADKAAAPERARYDRIYADCMRHFTETSPPEKLTERIDTIDAWCRKEAQNATNTMVRKAPAVPSLGMTKLEQWYQQKTVNDRQALTIMTQMRNRIGRTLDEEELAKQKEILERIIADPNISNDIKKEAAALLLSIETRKQEIEEFSQWLEKNGKSYDPSTQEASPSSPTLPQQQNSSAEDRRGFKTANRRDSN